MSRKASMIHLDWWNSWWTSVGNSYILISFFFFNITLVHLDGNDFFYVTWRFFTVGIIFFPFFLFHRLLLCVARPANWCTYIIFVCNTCTRLSYPHICADINGVCKPTALFFMKRKHKPSSMSKRLVCNPCNFTQSTRYECSSPVVLWFMLAFDLHTK